MIFPLDSFKIPLTWLLGFLIGSAFVFWSVSLLCGGTLVYLRLFTLARGSVFIFFSVFFGEGVTFLLLSGLVSTSRLFELAEHPRKVVCCA